MDTSWNGGSRYGDNWNGYRVRQVASGRDGPPNRPAVRQKGFIEPKKLMSRRLTLTRC